MPITLSQQQRREIFRDYFRIFPCHSLPPGVGVGIHVGCGTCYADKSFYVMRTDAYDRFCTRLEKRFTRSEIERLRSSGFIDVLFSNAVPFWCAVGIKAPER